MKNLSYFLYGCAALAFVAILPIDSFAFYMFVRVVLFTWFLLTLFMVLDYSPRDCKLCYSNHRGLSVESVLYQ